MPKGNISLRDCPPDTCGIKTAPKGVQYDLHSWHKNYDPVVNTINMKTTVCIPLGMALMVLVACGDGNTGTDKTTDSSTVNQDHTTNADTATQSTTTSSNIDATPLDEKTGKWATEAAGGGMMEVTLGQTAQQQAASQRVKDFGSMMVRDHTKANDELKSIAAAKNFTLPAMLPEKHQKHVDDLSKKQGNDFDKAYMKMMVDDHEEDVKKFEKAASDATDPAIKDFAARTLPTLRAHLDSAKAINKALK
jgi:putative membrane protein